MACYLAVVLTIWGHLLMGICLWYSRQTCKELQYKPGATPCCHDDAQSRISRTEVYLALEESIVRMVWRNTTTRRQTRQGKVGKPNNSHVALCHR